MGTRLMAATAGWAEAPVRNGPSPWIR